MNGVFGWGEFDRQPYRALDSDPHFAEIAEGIEGWEDLKRKAAILEAELARPRPNIEGRTLAALGQRIVNEDLGFDQAIAELTEAAAAEAAYATSRSLLSQAGGALAWESQQWVGRHEGELCAKIQRARVDLQQQIAEAVAGLTDVTTADDLAKYPEAAPSYAAALTLTEQWKTWRGTHVAVLHLDGAAAALQGIDWWQDFSPHGVPAPWTSDEKLDLPRFLATARTWTPTKSQVRDAIATAHDYLARLADQPA